MGAHSPMIVKLFVAIIWPFVVVIAVGLLLVSLACLCEMIVVDDSLFAS